ncbi:MAG: right-handed parallel beta-helix repeat-containing protein [Candidatus Thorarchaeota archaeon]|jgi:hypothetical protein
MPWSDGDDLSPTNLNNKGPGVFNLKDQAYGAVGDGSTDDTSALTTAISSATDGDTILFPSSSSFYKITATIDVDRALKFKGENSEVQFTTSNITGFSISVGTVSFTGLRITGAQNTTSRSRERAIHFSGDTATYLRNVSVKDCHIRNWGYMGISGEYTRNFDFSNNLIEEINYGGIHLFSCEQGVVGGNSIHSITDSGTPKYGITCARGNADTLVQKPRSRDIAVVGNTITQNDGWHGLDTHGGENISFVGNSVVSCYDGIAVGPASTSTNLEIFAPLNISVVGNVFDSGVEDGTYRYGISINGADGEEAAGNPIELATGVAVGNTVRNYGDEDSSLIGAITMKASQGFVITGNRIENPSARGISLIADNYDFVCSSNVIQDPWTDTLAEAVGIKVDGDYQVGYIGENVTALAGKSATTNMDKGIRIDNNSNMTIRVGQNISEAPDPFRDDSGSAVAMIPSTISTEGSVQIGDTDAPLSIGTATDFNDMTVNQLRVVYSASGMSLGISSGDTLYILNAPTSDHSVAQPTS